jgi:methyltransferase (TIGR00027 family)
MTELAGATTSGLDWSPEFMTQRAHAVVPMLGAIGWRVLEVEEGYCRSLLPLTRTATNQNGTHQAGLITMAMDFTGGLAVTFLFRYPIAGVHVLAPPALRAGGEPDDRASAWTVAVSTKYHRPSSDDLIVEARLPDSDRNLLLDRFAAGLPAVASVSCRCTSGLDGRLVADGRCTYLVQQVRSLRPSADQDHAGTLFMHLTTASARLIAGIRARMARRQGDETARLYEELAGRHGLLLAERFLEVLPELDALIQARGDDLQAHLDREVSVVRQVVFAGVGLDVRPLRLVEAYPRLRVFEVDLPEMLEERRRRLSTAHVPLHPRRHQVAANLEHLPLSQALARHSDFDPGAPTLVVLEGVSMYLEQHSMRRLIEDLSIVLAPAGSSAWLDTVDDAVVRGLDRTPAVTGFLENLALLGEPFQFGIDDPGGFFGAAGLTVTSRTAADYVTSLDHAIFTRYRFHTLRKY